MTKKEFYQKMAEDGNIGVAEAQRMTNLFLDTLYESLCEDGKVKFSEFGNFEIKTAKARKGRNPKTGNPCHIPERKVIRFKVSKMMIKKLNE